MSFCLLRKTKASNPERGNNTTFVKKEPDVDADNVLIDLNAYENISQFRAPIQTNFSHIEFLKMRGLKKLTETEKEKSGALSYEFLTQCPPKDDTLAL